MRDDPRPRESPKPYGPFSWPQGPAFQLTSRTASLAIDLVALLEQRQTRRNFSSPLDDISLGEFLWLAARNRSSRSSPYGFDQESRVCPSAGAVHPIHILVARAGSPWMKYDPIAHTLAELSDSAIHAADARQASCQLIDPGQGILIGLVAESGKTAAKYENHESLVWRDSGVALGYMSIVAEALGLSFCPLGITGHPFLTGYLENTSTLEAVGLAVLGRP